ncbi:MAG TPA: aminotransferase class III-fold pyridoxal phosphate-dependent enzyme [Verrucomicrobiae bacterium]|nr:aminotransferase class III-fold pyridoxal phosphate-dependent enzyme [Verrucomicrobiae bacterium]
MQAVKSASPFAQVHARQYNFRMMPEARVAAPVTSEVASRIARSLYGLEAPVHSLPGEYDDNFLLCVSDSQGYVLKIMHPAREESFVDMQCRALLHLVEHAPHLALPRVVPTRTGELFSRFQIESGGSRLVWLLTYVPGTTLAQVRPRSSELFASLGTLLAKIDAAFLHFSHPATNRNLKWDVSRALWTRGYLHHINDAESRKLVEQYLNLFESEAVPRFPQLRRSVIYGDANDHNTLVSPPWPQPRHVLGVIDFGDMHDGYTVAEPAVAAAYAILGQQDPLVAAGSLLAAYHKVFPLNEHEIAAFYPFLCARLAVSVVNSAHRQQLVPDDPYVTVTEAPAWQALKRLEKIHPRLALYTFRAACGFPPVPQFQPVRDWLLQNASSAAPVIPQSLTEGNSLVLDLSVASPILSSNPVSVSEPQASSALHALMRAANVSVAVGRYDEPRPVYTSPLFAGGSNPNDERRTIHLGIDLFAEPGTPVRAPFEATVHAFADNQAALDYGPVVILKHQVSSNLEFFTLYGHLSRESLSRLHPGDHIKAGQMFARVGTAAENGGWTPHLHLQIILDLLDLSTDFPGVAYPSQRAVFTSLSPDPNLILGIPQKCFPLPTPTVEATLAARKDLLGGNLSVSYSHPLKIVRGWRQYLYDETGRAYLDVYNNVPLVGHSHSRVVAAVQQQIALLNTNTRYLHDNILHYAARLTALLPAQLKVCYFLNSGSEANELAIRLARIHTHREDVIVLEHAYHGHTSTLIDISPYKFNGPGGAGQKPWVHVAPIADDYRGLYRRGELDIGNKYATHVADILRESQKQGRPIAAYIAETVPSVAGQIVFPPGYLAETYKHVRASGAVCIADEVQVGFGRLGSHFWGFDTQGVVPDMVVLGKPIGNAFPLAAVVTTPEIAASFNNCMEFFSTFGGNPVACAAGLSVLDVLRDENLQQNAFTVGARWIEMLRELRTRHPLIGDVRGSGLFLGIDLVNDRSSRTPATEQASYVVNRLRDRGILTGTDGPHHNVIKLRPPLIFSDADADLFTTVLDEVLLEDPAQPHF